MELTSRMTELLWIGAIAAVPLGLLVAFVCRLSWTRPATRHALWLAVMLSFVTPAIFAAVWRPGWFTSERILAGLEAVAPAASAAPAGVSSGGSAASRPSTRDAAPSGSLPSSAPSTGWVSFLGYPVWPRVGGEPASLDAVVQLVGRATTVRQNAPPRETRHAGGAVHRRDLPDRSGDVKRAGAAKAIEAAARSAGSPTPGVLPALPDVTPARADVAAPGVLESVKTWVGHALSVRDSVAALPPIPAAIWLGGLGMIVAVWLTRFVVHRRVIASATPAPEPTRALVRWAAGQLGLRREPEAVMVSARMSPMIWCGGRTRLVLPEQLWGDLDDTSRRAVLLHEFAHLRRRDHWMYWMTSAIGAVFWWHPVAWWAGRRLHDEAETCCDAWVMSILPGRRREYAETLVAAKSFVSVPGRFAGPCLGVMSGRTKRLARRLTMVMTQRVAPRSSVFGLFLALSVAATGTFVMPGLACPPEKNKQKQTCETTTTKKIKVQPAPKAKSTKSTGAPGVQFLGEAPALEAMMGQPEQPGVNPHGAPEETIDRLEEQLRRLERQAEELQRIIEQRSGRPGYSGVVSPRGITAGVLSGSSGRGTAVLADGGAESVREYSLPGGKLEALTELMARQDVPILIERRDDRIVVHGTARDHEVFGAFVRLIHPEAAAGRGVTGPSRAVSPADARRAAPATAPRPASRAAPRSSANPDTVRQLEQLRKAARDLERSQRDIERNADRARDQAQDRLEKADKYREMADELRDKADEAKGSQKEKYAKDLERLISRADAFASEAASAEAEAAALEAALSNLENEFELMEQQIAQLEEAIEDSDESAVPAARAVPSVPSVPITTTSSPTTPSGAR